MVTSLIRLLLLNRLRLFDYLTQYEILQVVNANHGLREEYFQRVCQVRVERRKLLDLFRKEDRWKELFDCMKDPSKQLIVNQSKKVIQGINKHITIASKSEFLEGLKVFPVYSIIPQGLHFPSLHSLTIEYELYLFICELSEKNHYHFAIQSLDLFTFASSSSKIRKAVANWIEPYLQLVTKKLSIKDWPFINNNDKKKNGTNQFFPRLSSSLELLSFHSCASFRLDQRSLPNLQTLVLRATIITNLKDFTHLRVLELSHQSFLNAKEIPKVKKLILKKCLKIKHLNTLHGIEEVEINECNIKNYNNLFKDVKRLTVYICPIHKKMHLESHAEDDNTNQEINETLDEDHLFYDDQAQLNEDQFEEQDANIVNDVAYSTDIRLDLSQFPQLQHADIFDYLFEGISGSLISKPFSKTLRTLKLEEFRVPTDLSYYCANIDTLELTNCDNITSLEGLGKVRRLSLIGLDELESLDGLGGNYNGTNSENCGNQYVRISYCNDDITDFSPLKHIKEVEIESCGGFTDGFEVDHVHTLTLRSCRNIVDISMLHEVQRLKLYECDKILSLNGLENVSNLTFERCRHLQLQQHQEPVYKKDYGVRIILDVLTGLPDSLYPLILQYLENKDQLSVIHSNCYLYQRLIRQYRIFQIKVDYGRPIEAFFVDVLFREKVFDRIEDTSKQLKFKEHEKFDGFYDLPNFSMNGWSEVEVYVSTLPTLLHCSDVFPMISSLHVSDFYPREWRSVDREAFISFISRVKDQLTLRNMAINFSLHLPMTLKHLTFDHCFVLVEKLQMNLLMNLRTLTIQNNTKLFYLKLLNVNNHNLDRLTLRNLEQIINLKLFNTVKELYLYHCNRLRNIITLQDNEKIVIDLSQRREPVQNYNSNNDNDGEEEDDDGGNDSGSDDGYNMINNNTDDTFINLLYCFRNSKNIELSFINHKIAIDLSYCHKVQRFSLKGSSLHLISNTEIEETTSPSFYTKNIPTSLRVLKLHGIKNLTTLGSGNFDHLQSLELVRCDDVTSLLGLGNIPFIRLEDLRCLSSLEGLGNRNHKVILKEIRCKDFIPVKRVYDLTLISCPYFTSMPVGYDVKRLRVKRCGRLEYLRCEGLEQLEVFKCDYLKVIDGMERVKRLIIKDCVCLDDYPSDRKVKKAY